MVSAVSSDDHISHSACCQRDAMSYKSRSLFRVIEILGRHELLLPHIQRPFVWQDDQMVRLFDSLMRTYPIQTLLFEG